LANILFALFKKEKSRIKENDKKKVVKNVKYLQKCCIIIRIETYELYYTRLIKILVRNIFKNVVFRNDECFALNESLPIVSIVELRSLQNRHLSCCSHILRMGVQRTTLSTEDSCKMYCLLRSVFSFNNIIFNIGTGL